LKEQQKNERNSFIDEKSNKWNKNEKIKENFIKNWRTNEKIKKIYQLIKINN
jgi:hypothetical protein